MRLPQEEFRVRALPGSALSGAPGEARGAAQGEVQTARTGAAMAGTPGLRQRRLVESLFGLAGCRWGPWGCASP
eukprot:9832971-Alexandrium_andersonii.AAC.1